MSLYRYPAIMQPGDGRLYRKQHEIGRFLLCASSVSFVSLWLIPVKIVNTNKSQGKKQKAEFLATEQQSSAKRFKILPKFP